MSSSRRLLILVSTMIAFSVVLNGLPPWRIVHRNRNSGIPRRREEVGIDKAESWDPNRYTSLYVRNVDVGVSEEVLNDMFSEFGKITSLVLAKDSRGESRGFAFIDFQTSHAAKRAAKLMNGTRIGKKVVHIERTPKKEEGRDPQQYWFW